MEEYVLELEGYEISHKRGSKECILRIPSFKMKKGDIVFLRGRNGSGKSTMLKALFSFDLEVNNYIDILEGGRARLYSSYGFELDLLSRECSICKRHKSISYLEQDDIFGSRNDVVTAIASHAQAALIETVDDKIEFAEKKTIIEQKAKRLALNYFDDIYKCEKKYRKESNADKKDDIALKILKKKPAQKCSFGQKKMINILAAYLKSWIMKSDLFVMDEPLNHLDSQNKSKIVNLLSEYVLEREQEGNPITMIIISHCLIFPFINKENCHQWLIKNRQLEQVKDQDKIYSGDCLKDERDE